MEPPTLHAGRSGIPQVFRELSPDERRHLYAWCREASTIGIDSVEDLTSRPWPCPVAGTVIGVFQAGAAATRWLVIGQNDAWVVACCADSVVSRTFHSLAEALSAICPGHGSLGKPDLIC